MRNDDNDNGAQLFRDSSRTTGGEYVKAIQFIYGHKHPYKLLEGRDTNPDEVNLAHFNAFLEAHIHDVGHRFRLKREWKQDFLSSIENSLELALIGRASQWRVLSTDNDPPPRIACALSVNIYEENNRLYIDVLGSDLKVLEPVELPYYQAGWKTIKTLPGSILFRYEVEEAGVRAIQCVTDNYLLHRLMIENSVEFDDAELAAAHKEANILRSVERDMMVSIRGLLLYHKSIPEENTYERDSVLTICHYLQEQQTELMCHIATDPERAVAIIADIKHNLYLEEHRRLFLRHPDAVNVLLHIVIACTLIGVFAMLAKGFYNQSKHQRFDPRLFRSERAEYQAVERAFHRVKGVDGKTIAPRQADLSRYEDFKRRNAAKQLPGQGSTPVGTLTPSRSG